MPTMMPTATESLLTSLTDALSPAVMASVSSSTIRISRPRGLGMGHDITFHPVSRAELKHWFFSVVERPALAEQRIEQIIDKPNEREWVAGIYGRFAGWFDDPTHPFESTFAFAAAALAGYLHPYWYARGQALSFAMEEDDAVWEHLYAIFTPLPDLVPGTRLGALDYSPLGQLNASYSASGLILPEQIPDLEAALPTLAESESFDDEGLASLTAAIAYAKKHETGIIEASDLVVPATGECLTYYANWQDPFIGDRPTPSAAEADDDEEPAGPPAAVEDRARQLADEGGPLVAAAAPIVDRLTAVQLRESGQPPDAMLRATWAVLAKDHRALAGQPGQAPLVAILDAAIAGVSRDAVPITQGKRLVLHFLLKVAQSCSWPASYGVTAFEEELTVTWKGLGVRVCLDVKKRTWEVVTLALGSGIRTTQLGERVVSDADKLEHPAKPPPPRKARQKAKTKRGKKLLKTTCGCGRVLRAKPKLAGKRVRCPQCREPVRLPKA